MTSGDNNQNYHSYGAVTDASYERFREELGLPTTNGPSEPSLAELRSVISSVRSEELAAKGAAIREDLSEPIDSDLLTTELERLAARFDRFEELEAMGAPEHGETPYMDLTEPAWTIENHLTEIGFFDVLESHLPEFSSEHIEATTKSLMTMGSLPTSLSTLEFSDDEQVALVTNIINSSDRLSWWAAADLYEQADSQEDWGEKVRPDFVPPLHKRAMAGSLLWMDGLDWRLWQYEVLLTEQVIEECVWDVKSMLAGVYLFSEAVRDLAEDTISDEDLATLLTASTATMIIGQEQVADDVARLNDDQRRPVEEVANELEVE